MKAELARHDLLRVAPESWDAIAAARPSQPALSDAAARLVATWGREGWPVIVRRPMPGDPSGALPVGLPLPPSLGKARVALTIPAEIEVYRVDAVSLGAARAEAPAAWHATIDGAVAFGEKIGFVPYVFGALLWQSLTGLTYIHEASDLDLLCPVPAPAAIDALLDGLDDLDADAPMRIDGEVRTRAGDVNWRELASARKGHVAVVLAKTLRHARFVTADEVFGDGAETCP